MTAYTQNCLATTAPVASATKLSARALAAIGIHSVINLCQNFNANPTALTGVSKTGDAAATLTVVSDTAALAAAGLSGICTVGNVYKLDNSAGVALATADISGSTPDANSYTYSAYLRGSGTGSITSNVGGVGSGNKSMTGSYVQYSGSGNPAGAGGGLRIVANAGAVVFFILNQLESGLGLNPVVVVAGAAATGDRPATLVRGRNLLASTTPAKLFTRGRILQAIGTYPVTNLLTQSQTFDNAAWSNTNASVTPDTIIAPDGTLTADKLVENNLTGQHFTQQNFTFSNIAYTTSVYAKPGGHDYIRIALVDSTGVLRAAYFNITTGTLGTVAGSFIASIVPAANGFYRCIVTWTSNAAANSVLVGNANADNTVSYPGDGTSGAYLWGAQLQTGITATEYVPTVAAAASGSPGRLLKQVGKTLLAIAAPLTNFVLQSKTLLTTPWATVSGLLIATSSTVGPDGSAAFDLTQPTQTATVHLDQSVSGLVAGKTYIGSAFILKDAIPQATRAPAVVISTGGITIDTSTGAFGLQPGSTSGGCVQVGSWWWVWFTFVAGTNFISLQPARNQNVSNPNNTGWGANPPATATFWQVDVQNSNVAPVIYIVTTVAAAISGSASLLKQIGKFLLYAFLRSNLLLQSQTFNNATSWSNVTATVASGQTTGPDGTLSGWSITSQGGGGSRLNQVFSATSTALTYYVIAKFGNTNSFNLLLRNNTTSANLTAGTFHLQTGLVDNTGSGTVAMIPLGDGWYICAVSIAAGISVGDNMLVYIYAGGTGSAVGDFVYAYGAQAEIGLVPTTFIPTTTVIANGTAIIASLSRQGGKVLLATTTPVKLLARSIARVVRAITSPVASRTVSLSSAHKATTAPVATVKKLPTLTLLATATVVASLARRAYIRIVNKAKLLGTKTPINLDGEVDQ